MSQLGRYELGPLLGAGGAGEVYRATLRGPGGLRKPVALKILYEGGSALRREARLGGLLRHRNLVDVYEVGEAEGRWFCAMEPCVGELAAHAPLPLSAVVDVGLQVCAALEYAQEELGLVHLDLKPANLLLSEQGSVKVADLGIARAEGFEQDGIRGTPRYMAPEQWTGNALDTRTDIYALGVTLAELAGLAPLHLTAETLDFDPSATVAIDASIEPRLPPTASGPLGPVLRRCVERDPADRWPDMSTLAGALRALELPGPDLREVVGVSVPAPTTRSSGLPDQAPVLEGRLALLSELAGTLDSPGALVLKGPAGIGKTALATAAACAWRDRGPAWRVELAEATDEDSLVAAVARVLDVPLLGDDPGSRLARSVAARGDVLVVLDTFEHLEACSGLVERWAEMAPQARWVLTSRSALALGAQVDVGPIDQTAAIDLLVARAQERGVVVKEDRQLTELALRLEGVPLALELAAGRLGVLGVSEVLDRLEQGILRAGSEGRHQTLTAALQWSWDLMSPEARAALADLSAFAGGFTAEHGEEVVRQPGFLDLLESLVDQSMVLARGERFGLLRGVRSFARPHRSAQAELRHGALFARFGTDEAIEGLSGPDGPRRVRALEVELDNLDAARARAIERRDVATAAALAIAGWGVLERAGPLPSAIAAFEEVLALTTLAAHPELGLGSAQAFRLAGRLAEANSLAESLASTTAGSKIESLRANLAWHRGDREAALAGFEAAAASCRARGDRVGEGKILSSLGLIHNDLSRFAQAEDTLRRSIAIHRSAGTRRYEAVARGNLAIGLLRQGRVDEAREQNERAIALHREVGARMAQAHALANLGVTRWHEGDLDRAMECYLRALELARELGERRFEANVLGNLGSLYSRLGDSALAESHFERAHAIHLETGDRRGQGVSLGFLAASRGNTGRLEESERLYKQAIELMQELGDRQREGHLWGGLGELCQMQERLEEALGHMKTGETLLREIGSPGPLVRLLCQRAAVLGAMGEAKARVQVISEAVAIADEAGARPGSEIRRAIQKALDIG